jgi:hypothetical protein
MFFVFMEDIVVASWSSISREIKAIGNYLKEASIQSRCELGLQV